MPNIIHIDFFLKTAESKLFNIMDAISRRPILSLSAFARRNTSYPPSVLDLTEKVFTTSGRSALYLALINTASQNKKFVIVPSYHCPTIVAPVISAGLIPHFTGINISGRLEIERIPQELAKNASAIIIPHYFGHCQSLERERNWCDKNGIALIEDCSHALFGIAGNMAVGTWGDYAVSSLTKFSPVPELGVIGSARRTISIRPSIERHLFDEIKGLLDIIEISNAGGNLTALDLLFTLKKYLRNTHKPNISENNNESKISHQAIYNSCDMSRIKHKPLTISMWLFKRTLNTDSIKKRRTNYEIYENTLNEVQSTCLPNLRLNENTVPYAYPFLSPNAEKIYPILRKEGFPVFRWDRTWPGSEKIPNDIAPNWRNNLIQFLCHQDLSEATLNKTLIRTMQLIIEA